MNGAAIKRFLKLALEGIVGNAAWALLLLAAVVFAAFLKGTVPAWLFGILLLLALGVSAFVATALSHRAATLRGARDEARQQAENAQDRAIQLEEKSDSEKRELREQLAAASGGQQPVSIRMQALARQIDALASVPTGSPYGPDGDQIEVLISLLEDFDQKCPGDPVVQGLLNNWQDSSSEATESAWQTTLRVLKARAVSIGTEEALS